KPDLVATDDIARCRPATAAPATPEPAEAAVDGTDATTWQADAPATHVTVDLGRAVALSGIDVTRPPVLAIASPVKGKNAVTGPTRSAAETIQVSSDGRSWQTVSSVAAPTLHDQIDATGHTAHYVRVVAGSNAAAQKPLVVGELGVRAAR
ncbi:MAG TPA: discoidin domain-containing protein, partial [Solirubrobacteraceae bacterium]